MSKHTIGPLSVRPFADQYAEGYEVLDSNDRQVAEVRVRSGQYATALKDAAEANARLIAAAPEMYAALNRVMQLKVSAEGDEVFAQVRAALAKAEGRE